MTCIHFISEITTNCLLLKRTSTINIKHGQILINIKRFNIGNSSVLRKEMFWRKMVIPPAVHNIFRYQKFSVTKGYSTNFFVSEQMFLMENRDTPISEFFDNRVFKKHQNVQVTIFFLEPKSFRHFCVTPSVVYWNSRARHMGSADFELFWFFYGPFVPGLLLVEVWYVFRELCWCIIQICITKVCL